jgi:hypothetical protein
VNTRICLTCDCLVNENEVNDQMTWDNYYIYILGLIGRLYDVHPKNLITEKWTKLGKQT